MRKANLSLIAAVAQNGVIGASGGLPWRLPSDLKRFKAVTLGRPVIMGRKTHESIGRLLPGRTNIVVTRSEDKSWPGVIVAQTLAGAVKLAQQKDGDGEIFVIGGGQLYAEAMSSADRLYITHVAATPEGDVFFPVIDDRIWKVASRETIEAGENDSAEMDFVIYERIKKS